MKEKKIFILALPTVIIIIITIIGISLIFYNRNLKEMDRDEIKNLAAKIMNIENISCEIVFQYSSQSDFQDITNYKMKDKKVISKNDFYTIYEDTEKGIKIQMDDEEKTAYVYGEYKDKVTSFQEILYMPQKLLESEEYQYNFIKYETMNGIKCVCFSVSNTDTTFDIWLDRDNGMIVKMECHYTSEENPSVDTVMHYRYQLNNVTDEDVKEPVLDEYTIVNL